ncbi:MAG: GYD domain-containing protein [Candidatus Omnitrophica bacterium]|nr:GYD domain-containing protein [Candidatus Omnitrophota bacterium]MCM8817460.1 GYD domain-containing protein [Candidatus Omnitrophota bacterium]
MARYIMLSTLTSQGAETIKKDPERIKQVNSEVEKMGGKIVSQYAVLGPYDFITILEAPDNETVTRISLEIGARGSVKILTLAAVDVDDFIKGIKNK